MQLLIQKRRDALDLIVARVLTKLGDVFSHVSRVRHDDGHDLARGQRHETDPLDRLRVGGGTLHDRRIVGSRREQPRGDIEDFFDALHLRHIQVVDAAPFLEFDLVCLHQRVDIVPVTGLGGYASGRSVRLADIAHLLEIGHHITNRRGTERILHRLSHRARSDGFRSSNVSVDNRLQNVFLSTR